MSCLCLSDSVWEVVEDGSGHTLPVHGQFHFSILVQCRIEDKQDKVRGLAREKEKEMESVSASTVNQETRCNRRSEQLSFL